MSNSRADILFVNGLILIQDDQTVSASQLAILGNRIMAVGNNLKVLVNEKTEIIDLQGAVVTPGFIDAHVHSLWGGESLSAIPLKDARSKASFMELITKDAKDREPGSWLKGGGWNEHDFLDGALPQKEWLDEAAPGHPMILYRHDGHSGVVSSAALAMAGINKNTRDPEGGVIDRNGLGEPTGILRDAAMSLVMSLIPAETEAELEKHLKAAQDYLLSRGVTAVGDMIYDMGHFHFLQKMARKEKLRVRFSVYTPLLKWPELQQILEVGVHGDEWFQFKGLKAFCDGSLGSHTALMLEPYKDTPNASGIYDTDWKDRALVKKIISEADSAGFQTMVHAIGDRAVREVLDIFQAVIEQNRPRDRRFRIEHAQHIHPEDQNRFSEMDVIASVQPAHCVDDSRYAEILLGERCRHAYPFKALQKTGAILAFGSDWPVSPADPVTTIHAAVKRAGWHMEQAVDFNSALKAHTAHAAYAGFREDDIGKLKAGYLADFVVLDPEFLELESQNTSPQGLIREVYVNGQKAY